MALLTRVRDLEEALRDKQACLETAIASCNRSREIIYAMSSALRPREDEHNIACARRVANERDALRDRVAELERDGVPALDRQGEHAKLSLDYLECSRERAELKDSVSRLERDLKERSSDLLEVCGILGVGEHESPASGARRAMTRISELEGRIAHSLEARFEARRVLGARSDADLGRCARLVVSDLEDARARLEYMAREYDAFVARFLAVGDLLGNREGERVEDSARRVVAELEASRKECRERVRDAQREADKPRARGFYKLLFEKGLRVTIRERPNLPEGHNLRYYAMLYNGLAPAMGLMERSSWGEGREITGVPRGDGARPLDAVRALCDKMSGLTVVFPATGPGAKGIHTVDMPELWLDIAEVPKSWMA